MIYRLCVVSVFLSSSTCCFAQIAEYKPAIITNPAMDESSLAFNLDDLSPKKQEKNNRPKKKYVKTTKQECEIRGGEYIAHKDALPNDMVDCILPSQTRNLGGGFGGGLPGETLSRLSTVGIRGIASQKILGSAYDYLYRVATEKPRYGLYSYVLLPGPSPRSDRVILELFKSTSFVEVSGINYGRLNIIYLPTKEVEIPDLLPIVSDGSAPPVHVFNKKYYDYSLARKLLTQICDSPSKKIQDICRTDLSRGPYLFTYPSPASALSPVPPPYLFVDLSGVHERAFGEFIAAYKEQVKRPDFSDLERIENLRLRVLSIVLTAADWIDPIRGAIADTVYMVEDQKTGK